MSWSPDLQYQRNGDVRQFSDSCQLTNSPSWSQRLILENDFQLDENDGKLKVNGSFWLVVLDSQKNIENGENFIDEVSIPMTFMIPYRPIHLEVTMSDGIGKVYISLLLTLKKGLPEGSLTDLTTFGVKWSSFDPLPHCVHKCSYWIAPCGFKVGHQVPWTKCDTRDANSMSRAFFLQKQISNKTLE